MNTPTLGYEEDTKMSKREVANVQLEEAIALFVAEKFLCALTLAGAAEEILARLANAIGQPSAMEKSAQVLLELKQKTGAVGLADVTEGKLFKSWNKARNSAKHHSQDLDEMVVLNFFDEAYWMIRRALANAKVVGVRVRNEVEFENWIVVNINL